MMKRGREGWEANEDITRKFEMAGRDSARTNQRMK